MITSIAFVALLAQTTPTNAGQPTAPNAPSKPAPQVTMISKTELLVEGQPGIPFMGYCVSSGSTEERRFEGVTPAKITWDVEIEKCSVSAKEKGGVTLRFFQDQQLIYTKNILGPVMGVNLVIPLGSNKKNKK